VGSRGVHLRWQSPDAAGDGRSHLPGQRPVARITRFMIAISSDGGVTWQMRVHRSPVPATVLRGLPDGVHHIFRVAAFRGAAVDGFGNSKLAINLVPPSSPVELQVTRRPVFLTVLDINGGPPRVIRSPNDFVTWKAPERSGGKPVQNYIVQYSTDRVTWTTHSRPVHPGASHGGWGGWLQGREVAISPPAGDGAYWVRVAAETAVGRGAFAEYRVA
jgi:hypothetical protein